VDDSAGKGCGHEWRITGVEGPTVGVLKSPRVERLEKHLARLLTIVKDDAAQAALEDRPFWLEESPYDKPYEKTPTPEHSTESR
jgi:hypothetical protein